MLLEDIFEHGSSEEEEVEMGAVRPSNSFTPSLMVRASSLPSVRTLAFILRVDSNGRGSETDHLSWGI